MYGFSAALLAGGDGRAALGGHGTVMRPATLRHYATEAGFSGIGNPSHRQ